MSIFLCVGRNNFALQITNIMATTTFQPSVTSTYAPAETKSSLLKGLWNWCADQNKNRLLWLGVILAGHGCILTPLTAMVVLGLGAPFYLIMATIVAMAMALVTNLAAMPTKYTLPVFFLSVLIDLVVVVLSIVMVTS
jgi:hypothetical protein